MKVLNKGSKIHKGIRVGLIVLGGIIVLAILMHLTMNYLVPFIGDMHNNGGAY